MTTLQKKYRTAVVYDEQMMLHSQKQDAFFTYPELAVRVERIMKGLSDSDLLKDCVEIPSRSATKEELMLCHTESYIDEVLSNQITPQFGEYHVSDYTGVAASLSCGSCLQMVDAVMKKSGKVDNGFCVTRPPGHHAMPDKAMGFCYFANAAISAKYAIQKHGAKKVAIVDWDVHHGNGSQACRLDNENILFISTHRNFYPFTGSIDNVGEKKNTINVCFERFGDEEILDAFERVILPATKEFGPDLIIISAGYDAVDGDPLGICKVAPETFGTLTRKLMSITGGTKVIGILEGGYNLDQLTNSVVETVRCLQGAPARGPALEDGTTCSGDGDEIIKQVLKKHSGDWECFKEYADLKVKSPNALVQVWRFFQLIADSFHELYYMTVINELPPVKAITMTPANS